MSEDQFAEYYYHLPFDNGNDQRRNNTGETTFPFSGTFPPSHNSWGHNSLQIFDPAYLSYSEYFHGSTDLNSFSSGFGLSPEMVSVAKEERTTAAGGGETPATPNSSISSVSTELAENDENTDKSKKEVKEITLQNEEDESSKRDGKSKKKGAGGKKERQPQFAFMTKSEVDHLEDGYRWRKYGQKAVKNSPYPRSYYRCTTQKCLVKKRVERSFEDPSIVVTTYEGQHNHHVPATVRGNVAARIYSPSMLSPPFVRPEGPRFSQEVQTPHHQGTRNVLCQQLDQFPDYGLLQDIIPHVSLEYEP